MFGLKKGGTPGMLGVRSFSTSKNIFPDFGLNFNIQNISKCKKFANPNFVNKHNPSLRSCQNYCTTSSPMKIYKHPETVDKSVCDEIGVDPLMDPSVAKMPSSPICIALCGPSSQEITISITPESFGRKTRLSSDCASEDSFIIFDCGSDVAESTDDDDTDGSFSETGSDGDDSDLDQVDFVRKAPIKKVRFSEKPCEVHNMIKWSFAYQAARKGPWEEYARDRCRFKDRVAKLSEVLGPVLRSAHRCKIFNDRFKDC